MSEETEHGLAGWAPFPLDTSNRIVHVAPAYKNTGAIIPPHILSPQCPCNPRMEYSKKGVQMWIHEQIN